MREGWMDEQTGEWMLDGWEDRGWMAGAWTEGEAVDRWSGQPEMLTGCPSPALPSL